MCSSSRRDVVHGDDTQRSKTSTPRTPLANTPHACVTREQTRALCPHRHPPPSPALGLAPPCRVMLVNTLANTPQTHRLYVRSRSNWHHTLDVHPRVRRRRRTRSHFGEYEVESCSKRCADVVQACRRWRLWRRTASSAPTVMVLSRKLPSSQRTRVCFLRC